MTKLLHTRKYIVLLIISFIFLFNTTHSQTVMKVYGNFCINSSVFFAYSGPGVVTSWYISWDGVIVNYNSGGYGIEVQWSSAVSNGIVVAYYQDGENTGEAVYSDITVFSVTPSVSITPPSTVLLNNAATFTANPVNGGTSPSYQWQINGVNVNGATSSSFSPTITSGAEFQTISVIMNSNATCVVNNPATASTDIEVLSANWENLNYVRVHTATIPGVDDWVEMDGLTIGDKFQSTTYLDGLGRAIQDVEKGISPSTNNTWKDIVKHYEYDAAGRIEKDFIPYATSDNAGKFKTNAAITQPGYIQTFFGEPSTAPTYSLVVYDNSPLNRVLKTMAPGESWGGDDKGISGIVDFNKDDEKVHTWTIDAVTDLPVSSPTAVYGTGKLSRSVAEDENNNKVITYTDFSGNLILKKVQKEASPGIEHDDWVCTYYVYDDFNRLRYIISPKAVAHLDNNAWSFDQTIADELCFKYVYDAKGRPIIKKQPGVDEVWMVYDKKDRPVFSQDGKQRSQDQWTTTLYDNLNRTVLTGLTTYASNLQDMQDDVDVLTTTPTNPNTGLPLYRVLNANNTTGTYTALMSITMTDGFETTTGGNFTAEIVPGPGGSDGVTTVIEQVAVNLNPIPCSSCFVMLTTTYYDDYEYPGAKPFNTTYDLAYTVTSPILPTAKTNRITGMVTGEKIRVLDGDNNYNNDKFLHSTAYYDEEGRVLETLVDNIKDATDYQVNQFDFSGKLMSTYTNHSPGGSVTHSIVSKNEYDKTGRLIEFSKKFNNTFYKKLAAYSYDELGQVKKKRLAPGYVANGEFESLTYDYNIRGWLTGINKDYALGDNDYTQWDHYFGMYLGYDNRDDQFAAPQLNGNITGVTWRSQGDNHPRKFDYQYDRLDRFTNALFNQKEKPSETSWAHTRVDFTTTVQYEDDNGNIKSMKQMGIVPGVNHGVTVDDLRYSYIGTAINGLTGNKLKQVEDLGDIGNNNGLLNDFKDANTTQDYWYDVNGNLVKDLNKGIKNTSADGITYNFMNKPVKVVIENKSTIEFTYDAAGEKLQKKVTYTNNSVRLTTYIGDYVYEEFIPATGSGNGEQLQFVLHEEGRVKIITPHLADNNKNNDYNLYASGFGILNWSDNGAKQGVFEYFIKDHLGSTRMVLTEESYYERYLATMESELAVAAEEERLFGQVDQNGNPIAANELQKTRLENSTAPGIWPGNNTDVVKLTASSADKVIGPNMILKVMAGDIVNSTAKYYYINNSNSGSGNLLDAAAASFAGAMSNGQLSAVGKNQSSMVEGVLNPVNGDLGNFLNGRQGSSNAPKAYLNMVFLDEQFNFIAPDPVTTSVGSRADRVNSANNPTNATVNVPFQTAPKNGWVFVFLSNESDEPVYFDDLRVSMYHGAIAEENHYYPYGQKIAGISSRAFNKLENKSDYNNYNYQGDFAEHEEETGWDEFALRMYDPQIGRWNGADPYDEFASPYVGMGDNPIISVDPDGGSISAGGWGALIGAVGGAITGYAIAENNGWKYPGLYAVLGGLAGAGLGYATGESLFGAQSGPYFGAHLRAFYKGLFGGGGSVNTIYNGYNDPLNVFMTQVDVPSIWRSLANGASTNPAIINAAGAIATNLPIIRNRQNIAPTRLVGPPPQIIGPPSPPPNVCPCRNIVPIAGRPQLIPIAPFVSFMDGASYYDARISNEQFNALSELTTRIRQLMRPGDVLINGRLSQSVYNFVVPVDLIPSLIGGGGRAIFDPRTNRRTNEWIPGVTVTSPVVNEGNTIYQNFTAQVRVLSTILGRRFGINVVPAPTRGLSTRTDMRLIFSGTIRRPGRIIGFNINCDCN